MVKVKLLCNRTGDDFQQSYGQVVSMSPAEARRHLADGLAELVAGEQLPEPGTEEPAVTPPETASKPQPQTAAKPRPQTGGRQPRPQP